MKIISSLFLLLFAVTLNAQDVLLNKVSKVNDNTDKFLFLINKDQSSAEYLGEMQVRGYSNNDAEVFSMIYKKAKEIGANTFSLKLIENVDGTFQIFNPSNYFINLYYTPKAAIQNSKGKIFVFAGSEKKQKIEVNNEDFILNPRSYLVLNARINETNSISTKKFLGSTLRLSFNETQTSGYFQIKPFSVKGNYGLNFKSGDVIGLEESYANFLTVIYTKQN